jgi:predicted Zn-dependent protease
VAGADWEELLAKDGGAEAQFHLATMTHARQDLDGAIAGYGSALIADGLSPRSTVLAHRGRALALLATGKVDEGLAELAVASRLEPSNLPLLSEAMTLSIRHGNPAQALALASEAPAGMSDVGRVRFLMALALWGVGKGQEAAGMLREGIEIPDIREGEDGIAELWQEVCPGEPVPAHYRFGMH